MANYSFEEQGDLVGTAADWSNDSRSDIEGVFVFSLGPHGIVDTVNGIASPSASDLATAVALANEIKTQYNAHCATVGGVHLAADAVNVVTTAAATDLASLIPLVNEIKQDFNAHIEEATTVHSFADRSTRLLSGDASDLASAVALINECRANYTTHIGFVYYTAQENFERYWASNEIALFAHTISSLAKKAFVGAQVESFNSGWDLADLLPAEALTSVSGPYALTDLDTLDVEINGAPSTVTFHSADFADIGDATAWEVAQAIDKFLLTLGANTVADGTKVRVFVRGAGSKVQVTGGTANAQLQFQPFIGWGTAAQAVQISVDGEEVFDKPSWPTGHSGLLNDFNSILSEAHPNNKEMFEWGWWQPTDNGAWYQIFSDSPHGYPDDINEVVNIAAFDEDSCVRLTNELKSRFNAHIILTAGDVHGIADAGATVVVADATVGDLNSLYSLLNQLGPYYNTHRLNTTGGVHGLPDETNTVGTTVVSSLLTAIARANEIQTAFEEHRVNVDRRFRFLPGQTEARQFDPYSYTFENFEQAWRDNENSLFSFTPADIDAKLFTVSPGTSTQEEFNAADWTLTLD